MESAKVMERAAAWREPAVVRATDFIDGILRFIFLQVKSNTINSLMLG